MMRLGHFKPVHVKSKSSQSCLLGQRQACAGSSKRSCAARVMSRPHIPKWYEGEAELTNDWAMEEDLDSEDILMGDQ